MKTLTITSDDEKALQQVKELAIQLNVSVSEEVSIKTEEDQHASGERVAVILEEWHKKGGMKTEIPDPVAWQREVRKDRKLPFRD